MNMSTKPLSSPTIIRAQDNTADGIAKDLRFWNFLALLSIPLYAPVMIGISLAAVAAGGGDVSFIFLLILLGVESVAALTAVIISRVKHSVRWSYIALCMPLLALGALAVFGTLVTLVEFFGGLFNPMDAV